MKQQIPVAKKAPLFPVPGPWGLSVLISPVIFMLVKIMPGFVKLPFREETVELFALAAVFLIHVRACWLQRARKGYQDPEGYGYFLLLMVGGIALICVVPVALLYLLIIVTGFSGPV